MRGKILFVDLFLNWQFKETVVFHFGIMKQRRKTPKRRLLNIV